MFAVQGLFVVREAKEGSGDQMNGISFIIVKWISIRTVLI